MADHQDENDEKVCDRCSDPIMTEPIVVSVASGPLHPNHSRIRLCSSCADSMSRWMLRKRRSHRGRERSGARRSGTSGSEKSSARGTGRERPTLSRTERERRKTMIRSLLFVVLASGTGLLVYALAQFLTSRGNPG